jgi:multiple sugar transport system permease protein
MMAASLLPDTEILRSISPFPTSFQWQNYTGGWTSLSYTFTTFYLNSICISSLSVVGSVFASSLVAFAFARLHFPGRRVLYGLMLFTLMIPHHVTLIPQYVLFLNLGWIDTFIIPLSTPVLATAAIFSFIWTWDDFFGPLIYLSQQSTFNVPLALRAFAGATEQTNCGELFAMSTLSLILVFIIFILCQRLVINGAAGLRVRR